MDQRTRPATWIADGPVTVSYGDHIAHVTLNRPQASNGMTLDLMKALHAAIQRCHGDPRVRVVHLSGAGKNFCAGGDVREFASKGKDLGYFLRDVTGWLQMAVGAMVHMNAIVVTEVQGFAAGGGGLGLVCASDYVVAGESARFLAGATRVGMAPDAGSSVVLPRLVGFRRAMDIMMTDRVVKADEAERIGLVTRMVADDALSETAAEVCAQIANGAPLAKAATKRMLWAGLGLGIDAAMPEEARTVAELSGTADSREGLAAVIEKRDPVFTGA